MRVVCPDHPSRCNCFALLAIFQPVWVTHLGGLFLCLLIRVDDPDRLKTGRATYPGRSSAVMANRTTAGVRAGISDKGPGQYTTSHLRPLGAIYRLT